MPLSEKPRKSPPNLILQKTRLSAEHFCRQQRGSIFISFHAIVFETRSLRRQTQGRENRIYNVK